MGSDLPALSGNQLILLLEMDGWVIKQRATHGVALTKKVGERTLVAIVPTGNESLP